MFKCKWDDESISSDERLFYPILSPALDIKDYSLSPSLTARGNSTRGPRPTASQPGGQRPTVSKPSGPRPTTIQPAGPWPTIIQPAGPRPTISQQVEQRPTTNRGNQPSGSRGSTQDVEQLSVKPSTKNRVDGWVIGGIIMCCVILILSFVMYCLIRNKCRPRSSSGDTVDLESTGQRGQGSDDRLGRCTSNGVLNGSAATSNISNRDPTPLLTAAVTLAEGPPTYVSLNYPPHEVARESRSPSAEDLHQSSDDARGEVVVREAGWRPSILRSMSETSLPAYSEDMVISYPPA